jgi:hypothetical protein
MMMMTLGHRMWRGFVCVSVVLVFAPAVWFALGLGSTFFAPVMFEMAFSTFYVYSYVPSVLFLSYPDVSGKLGIPQTVFGVAVVFLYWFVISVLIGALLGLLRGLIWTKKKSSEPEGAVYGSPARRN